MRERVSVDSNSGHGDAVRGADLVFMPDPAFTKVDNAKRSRRICGGQVVFLRQGNSAQM